jgi:hypothetical protein
MFSLFYCGCYTSAHSCYLKITFALVSYSYFCREFEVDSVNFPGQVHRWRLSQLLQKGSERRRDALLGDMALALRFIIVTARARIVAPHFFSVRQALKSLLAGTLRLIGKECALI